MHGFSALGAGRRLARCLPMTRPAEHDPEPDRPEPLPQPGTEIPDQPIDEPPASPRPPPPVTARSDRAVYALVRARRIGMIH